MKRICFVNSQGYSAFKKESVGGTQLQLRNISRKLAEEEEYEVFFITRTGEGDREIDNVNLVDGINHAEGFLNKIFSGLKMIRKMKDVDADLYFSSNSNMEVGLVGLYCSLSGKKHVTRTVHSMQMDRESVLSRGLKGVVNHLGLRQADLIFVQCRDHENKLKAWFDPDTAILRNSFDIGERKNNEEEHVLWVGRRVEWKNPGLFLDLAEIFYSERFVMISPKTVENHELHEKIEKKASDIENLELIERVPRNEIKEYFDQAKVFVNTSDVEGFPNTFVEAGIGSTPILSYKVDPDSFIQEYECGYFADAEKRKLEKYLRQLIEDDGDSRRRGKNCRIYVESNHDLEENIDKVSRELQLLLDN